MSLRNGDVMYAVAKFDGYGKLSGKSSRTCAPARASKWTRRSAIRSISCCGNPRSPASPRGIRRGGQGGRAGTSSARRCRQRSSGEHFDIHGGGLDLKFPHHENEIAQSCARDGREVRAPLDAQRLREHRQREDVEVARQLLHGARGAAEAAPSGSDAVFHAVEPLSRADQLFAGPARAGGRGAQPHLHRACAICRPTWSRRSASTRSASTKRWTTTSTRPKRSPCLQTLTREINTARDAKKDKLAASLGAELRYLAAVLGLGGQDPAEWFRLYAPQLSTGDATAEAGPVLSNEEVQRLVDARAAARAAKNWAESDRLRDELAAAGVIVEDKPGGKATWRRK